MWRAVLVLAFLAVMTSSASAQPASIVIEAHAGDRPDQADRLLAPVYDALGHHGYRVGVEGVGKAWEENVSRAGTVDVLDVKDVSAKLAQGIDLRLQGNFAGATAQLEQTLGALDDNPALLASNQEMSKLVFRAKTAWALSLSRSGKTLAALEVMADVIRTFPDIKITRSDDGPEAAKLYDRAYKALHTEASGTLEVQVDDPTVNIFVNEVYAGSGHVKRETVAGDYRIYFQRGNTPGRLHLLKVQPGSATRLDAFWALEAALHTSPHWTGIELTDDEERQREVPVLAPQIARDVEAPQVVVLWFGDCGGDPALVGTVYDSTTGKPQRSAMVATTPDPPASQLRALGAYLGGDAPDTSLDVLGAVPECHKRVSHHSSHGWIKWTTAATSIATISAGAWLLSIDGKGTCKAPDGECAYLYSTAKQGYALVGVGAAAALVTGYLFIHDPWKHDRRLAVAPTESGGAMLTLAGLW